MEERNTQGGLGYKIEFGEALLIWLQCKTDLLRRRQKLMVDHTCKGTACNQRGSGTTIKQKLFSFFLLFLQKKVEKSNGKFQMLTE